jgi:hypothetical protein
MKEKTTITGCKNLNGIIHKPMAINTGSTAKKAK